MVYLDKSSVYFDTETTGLDDQAEIIQVGIIDGDGNVLFDSLVQAQGDIPQQAVDIHGITKADLENAPAWPDIHDQVCELLENAEVTKIYNANYDLRLLHQTAKRYDLEVPLIKTICVMKRYADFFCDGDWQKLVNACYFERIDTSHLIAHNAVSDCQMTRLLDRAIERKKIKRKNSALYKERFNAKKLALVPFNRDGFPYFGQTKRPKSYKTFSQLNVSDLNCFEFAGECCDTYGNRGYLFKPST